jgi:hypothetical protein
MDTFYIVPAERQREGEDNNRVHGVKTPPLEHRSRGPPDRNSLFASFGSGLSALVLSSPPMLQLHKRSALSHCLDFASSYSREREHRTQCRTSNESQVPSPKTKSQDRLTQLDPLPTHTLTISHSLRPWLTASSASPSTAAGRSLTYTARW